MRILICQTTRMGDVIQTSPLVHAVRAKHPDAHITLLVRRMGKTVAQRHPDADEVITYEEDEVFLDLCAQDSDRLLAAYNKADAFVQKLRDGRYDLAFNTTHSIASAMLMSLADIPKVVGADLSDDGQFVLRGRWINYFFTSVFHREFNDLNLCDITRHFVDAPPPNPSLLLELTAEDRAFAASLLERHNVGPDDFVACFQLGASEENKRWAEARFAGLARLLHDRLGARIFLLGISEEAPLGDAFAQHAPGLAVPLYGQTSIAQASALLERSRLLVTNDTGTMHMAAAVGCPVMLVSVGYVHFRETGPYGPGHCAIESRRKRVGAVMRGREDADERAKILPEQVMQAIEWLLESRDAGAPVQTEDAPEMDGVDVFMTRFAPDGCLQWVPVIKRPLTLPDFVRICYRAMWLDYLGTSKDKRAERQSLSLVLERYAPPPNGDLAAWRNDLNRIFGDFAALARRGVKKTERVLELLRKRTNLRHVQQLVDELMRLDEEARVFSEVNPACKPLARIARFERDNLEGADPLVLAETTLRIYQDGFARARAMQQKATRAAEVWDALNGI